jgi:protocatechuate 3,4-dioxygenase beta subunit
MSKRHTLGRHLTAARAARALVLSVTLCVAHALAQKEAPASVTGRVTDGEHGVAGVAVVVVSADPSQRFKPVARARTDAEGRYRVGGVPPGRYTVTPVAPVYVLQDFNNFPPGKPLTLSAGDSVEDTDFRLVRGAVITGRVTDADGNPVINEPVKVTLADPAQQQQQQQRNPIFTLDQRDISTDDRGVYRIYGIQPGRYHVSVGNDGSTFRAPPSRYYRRTFYPSAREESQGKVVEVSAGGEATDVDITLGSPEKTYRISGRFVMADTNQPVPVSAFGYGLREPSTGRLTGDYYGGSANARGEFQATGLAPGRYKVFAYQNPLENVDWYSDATAFEVTDADVSGLVVKLRRGSSVSGVVTIEGVSDRAAAARMLAGVRVYGFADQGGDGGSQGGYIRPVPLAPDGSFRLTGVRPGRLRINANSEVKGLAFERVEVGGAVQREGVEVAEGSQVTGVRITLVYGNAILRGQLNFPGAGGPPRGSRMAVIARRLSEADDHWAKGTEADSRGRFQIEGLAAGEYEVQARVFGGGSPTFMSEPQRVSVGEGGEVTISITLTPPPNTPAPPGGNQ